MLLMQGSIVWTRKGSNFIFVVLMGVRYVWGALGALIPFFILINIMTHISLHVPKKNLDSF